jgi:hypothetical protein
VLEKQARKFSVCSLVWQGPCLNMFGTYIKLYFLLFTMYFSLPRCREQRESFLLELARENTQLLINSIWNLPTERVEDVVVAKFPPPTFRLPREKPVPKPKVPTKWEKYAKEKGTCSSIWSVNIKHFLLSSGYRTYQLIHGKHLIGFICTCNFILKSYKLLQHSYSKIKTLTGMLTPVMLIQTSSRMLYYREQLRILQYTSVSLGKIQNGQKFLVDSCWIGINSESCSRRRKIVAWLVYAALSCNKISQRFLKFLCYSFNFFVLILEHKEAVRFEVVTFRYIRKCALL